jgi:cyanophycinase
MARRPTLGAVTARAPIFVSLIGGGWTADALPATYGPFLAAAGPSPRIACAVVDEGDGPAQFQRWAAALAAVAPCTPQPVLVAEGQPFDVAALADADGLLVCGGLNPAYAAAFSAAGDQLRGWLEATGRPYAGFSAGAVIAARAALVGGWRSEGVPVCPEDAAEDLDEVTVVAGLGLVAGTVDVHAAQWGTLPRLIDVVRRGLVRSGLAIDEDTAVTVRADRGEVAGLGNAYLVRAADADGVTVRVLPAGSSFNVAHLAP